MKKYEYHSTIRILFDCKCVVNSVKKDFDYRKKQQNNTRSHYIKMIKTIHKYDLTNKFQYLIIEFEILRGNVDNLVTLVIKVFDNTSIILLLISRLSSCPLTI
jgi:hypothetical protein